MVTPVSSVDPAADSPAWLQIDGAVIPWDDGVSSPQEATVLEEYIINGYREWLIEPLEDAPKRLELSVNGERLPSRQGVGIGRRRGLRAVIASMFATQTQVQLGVVGCGCSPPQSVMPITKSCWPRFRLSRITLSSRPLVALASHSR